MTRRKPKVLFFVSEDWYFASHRLPLAVAARDAGFEVVVVTRVDKAQEVIEAAGIRLVPFAFLRSGLNPYRVLRSLADLRRIYRAEAPDIVHHVAITCVCYGGIAAATAGIRNRVHALTGLGYVFSSADLKARFLRTPVEIVLRKVLKAPSTRVIVQNADDLEHFKRRRLAAEEDLRLIRGSGVEPRDFSKSDAVGRGPPMVVLPARMLRDKGVLEFVDAARLLKARGVEARFVLCGAPDPLNPTSISETELNEFAASGVIEYRGWQSDMGALLGSAQVVCLPSYREGLPKVLLEAAACSLPLVATDVPGCREIVRPGINGWLVPPGESGPLAMALQEAIVRPDLRLMFGAASRAIVENEMSLDRVIDDTLAVYFELLEGDPDRTA